MTARDTPSSRASSLARWAPWLLFVLLLVLMAWRPLATPDEGRYAEVGRWMGVSGDWLVQRLNGLPFFHKPPLLYWLEASSFALFGVSVWAARLVVALHAGGMAWLMWACARHWAGEATAQRALWVLGASAAFLIGGQYVNHDMMVATWIGVAIWCFARALLHAEGVHAGWGRAGFVACALGILSKGLIGVLLPGWVLFLWITWTRQWRKVWQLPWVSGLALMALIALPWFVLAERAVPGMLNYLFGVHQFGRFGATTFHNAQPVWFYLVALVVLMFPWALGLLAAALQGLWARGVRRETAEPTPPWVSLCWIWVVGILGFFSIPNSKLIGYALPVVAPVALLVAHAWQRHLAPRRWARAAFAALVMGNVALIVVAQHTLGEYSQRNSSALIAQVLRAQVQAQDTVVVVGGGEYPYDLPFLAQLPRPMEVVQDWAHERRVAGDTWHRELLDGADFDAQAARVLVPYDRLQGLDQVPHVWLVVERNSLPRLGEAHRWQAVAQGGRWLLYRSAP